jgi:hypothetical protein
MTNAISSASHCVALRKDSAELLVRSSRWQIRPHGLAPPCGLAAAFRRGSSVAEHAVAADMTSIAALRVASRPERMIASPSSTRGTLKGRGGHTEFLRMG